VRAGELDQHVKVMRQEEAVSTSGSGATLETWVQVTRLRARVTPVSSRETFTNDQRFASATHSFRVRFRQINPEWRLEWRGEQFNILGSLPGGQRLSEFVDIVAVSSVATNPEY